MIYLGTVNAKMTHHLNRNSGEVLKLMFRTATNGAADHMKLCEGVCSVVRIIARQEGGFAFISGVISSDGPQFIDRNIAVLADFTDHLRTGHPRPVMSAADVFHRELLDKHRNHTREEWAIFWRRVLASGVETLIMTPRWHLSYGAKDELEFAKERKMVVRYNDEDPMLLQILREHKVDI